MMYPSNLIECYRINKNTTTTTIRNTTLHSRYFHTTRTLAVDRTEAIHASAASDEREIQTNTLENTTIKNTNIPAFKYFVLPEHFQEVTKEYDENEKEASAAF